MESPIVNVVYHFANGQTKEWTMIRRLCRPMVVTRHPDGGNVSMLLYQITSDGTFHYWEEYH